MNADTAKQYTRVVGALYIITIVTGGWGESHVPSTLLINNNVAGTAHQVASSIGLFRASFASYLIEAACDITLNVLLYALLRPVSRNLALLAMCFGLMATAVFAAGEIFYFAAALPAVDADVARVLSPEIKAAFTYLCLTIYGYINGIFAVFYGTAAVVRGYLIMRSGYLPRTLGAFFVLGGAGFIAKNILVVVVPQYNMPYVLLPMFLAWCYWVVWLLVKGIAPAQWDAKQTVVTTRRRVKYGPSLALRNGSSLPLCRIAGSNRPHPRQCRLLVHTIRKLAKG